MKLNTTYTRTPWAIRRGHAPFEFLPALSFVLSHPCFSKQGESLFRSIPGLVPNLGYGHSQHTFQSTSPILLSPPTFNLRPPLGRLSYINHHHRHLNHPHCLHTIYNCISHPNISFFCLICFSLPLTSSNAHWVLASTADWHQFTGPRLGLALLSPRTTLQISSFFVILLHLFPQFILVCHL